MSIRISGHIQGNTFACDTGHSIQKFSCGLWGWLKHHLLSLIFERAINIDVQDTVRGKVRLYVPLSEACRIAGSKTVARLEATVTQILGTQLGRLRTEFRKEHDVPSTDLQVVGSQDSYGIVFDVFTKEGKKVGHVNCEPFSYKEGSYTSPIRTGRADGVAELLRDFRWPHGSFIYLSGLDITQDKTKRVQVAKSLLQAVLEFGNTQAVNGRVSINVCYADDVLLFLLGMKRIRKDDNQEIRRYIAENDLSDHGSKNMYLSAEGSKRFNQEIQATPIFVPSQKSKRI